MVDITSGSLRSRSHEVQRVGRVFRKRYPEFQYAFVESFTEHLTDLSRFFKGDLAEMLVFAVIGQTYLRAYIEHSRVAESHREEFAPPLISASRLSDVTCIPRQTVRRKLDALEQRGWIERAADASWTLRLVDGQSVARRDVHDLDERAIDRAAALFCDLKDLLPDQSKV